MLSAQFGDMGNNRRNKRKYGSSVLLSSSFCENIWTLSGKYFKATSLPTALA